MDEIDKCLDTYALIEIKLGNPKFKDYLNHNFVIVDLILAEFYSVLLREENEETANFWFKKLESYSIPASKEILIEAVKFRHKHKKDNISFFDAVGYIFSLKNGYKFVTGDKEFQGLLNVEFKKK
ncbi:MAG: PIN domain-containing protein [Nanoarchaeota archaeon]